MKFNTLKVKDLFTYQGFVALHDLLTPNIKVKVLRWQP